MRLADALVYIYFCIAEMHLSQSHPKFPGLGRLRFAGVVPERLIFGPPKRLQYRLKQTTFICLRNYYLVTSYTAICHLRMLPKIQKRLSVYLYSTSLVTNLVSVWSRIMSVVISCSHSRTVRECCKGDDASQWRMPKFNPPSRPNPVSGSHKNWHRWLRIGPIHVCKSSSRSAQGFRFRACVTLCSKKC